MYHYTNLLVCFFIILLLLLQVEPIYETADPIELNKLSWSNVTTIQNKYYNIGYMYAEIYE